MENQNNTQANKNLIIAFFFFQIIFIVFGIVSIKGLLVERKVSSENFIDQPSVSIDGLEESMPNSTSEESDIIKVLMLEAVSDNAPEINLNVDQVKLREDSIKALYFPEQNVNYYSAIMDIPSLEQSYWVFHEYSDEADNKNLSANDQYLILCLIDQDKIIYPEFQCKDDYGKLTYNTIAEKYLRWFKFDDFLLYEISVGENNKIKIVSLDTVNEGRGDEFIKKVKDAIMSLGISPEIFEYEVVELKDAPYVQWTNDWKNQ